MAEFRSLEPADPRRLGGYRLLSRLGSGGQGTVFLGEGNSGERVAVKLLQAVEDTAARARFVRELEDAGFVVEGAEEQTLPSARQDLLALRRRGAGTDLPANT